LTTNLFEHYRFSGDERDLRAIYPRLRDQTRFLLDVLVEHPQKHWLVTAPSNSPEDFPAWPATGRSSTKSAGSS
jgi:alpha-L-fucosidase 2